MVSLCGCHQIDWPLEAKAQHDCFPLPLFWSWTDISLGTPTTPELQGTSNQRIMQSFGSLVVLLWTKIRSLLAQILSTVLLEVSFVHLIIWFPTFPHILSWCSGDAACWTSMKNDKRWRTPFWTWHCWTTWCMSNATGAVLHFVHLNDCFSDEVPLRRWSLKFPKAKE